MLIKYVKIKVKKLYFGGDSKLHKSVGKQNPAIEFQMRVMDSYSKIEK